jgi:carbon storage regulator CsrA
MLVLSRKVGEKLVIDGNITVEIVKIKGNRITLGLLAPADVKILRGELKEHAAKPSKADKAPNSKTSSAGLLQHAS